MMGHLGREVRAVRDIRFDVGLLNQSDAARYLGMRPSTFQRWARGTGDTAPILDVLPGAPGVATVPFAAMAEAHVVQALHQAGVPRHKIRPALRRLQEEFGVEYALIAPNLATDGVDVLWDFSRSAEGSGLIEARTGQRVMRDIIRDYLQYLIWSDGDRYPRMMQLRSCLPSQVIIDPQRAFGQPIFARSRTRVADVIGMYTAGDEPEVIADELGVEIADVRTAVRVGLGLAA